MVNTVFSLLKYGENILKNHNIESSYTDSLILLCHLLKCDKTKLLIDKNKEVSDDIYNKYKLLIDKRKNKMPVKYITNNCEFMSLDFYVDNNVLIPRPDTEILVEETIKLSGNSPKILDLCCGSGCIGISLAHYIKNSTVNMVDISKNALNVANRNIENHNLKSRVSASYMDILNDKADNMYDIIVSNPPYISEYDYNLLEKDVKEYEPEIALISKDDEYKFYKRIITVFSENLNPNGIMLLEMGYNQSDFLLKFANETNLFKEIYSVKDFGGIERVLVLKSKGE